jgi:hypothetical protein
MDKISIGRLVHFVLPNGEHRPAIVVRVWPDEFPNNTEEKTGVNLQVFLDGTNDNEAYAGLPLPAKINTLHGTMLYTSAQYAMTPDGLLPGTWHWPERE